jgi:hypothetical protein
LGYFLFVATSATFTFVADLGDRMIAPLSIIASLGMFLWLATGDMKRNVLAFVFAGFLFIGGAITLLGRLNAQGRDAGFNSPLWQKSPTTQVIKQLASQHRLVSNSPEAVWWLSGFTTERIPYRERASSLRFLAGSRPEDTSRVLLYFRGYLNNPRYVPLEQVKEYCRVVNVTLSPDSHILMEVKGYEPDTCRSVIVEPQD